MEPAEAKDTPTKLFFSYSRSDRELRDQLGRHLAVLGREGIITSWHDRQIGAGDDWAGAINEHLNSADIILLLVSADFLASDYCYDVEMRRAMERYYSGDALVIPVLLRDVNWQLAPFSRLQALPTGGTPVTSWGNQDEAFADVSRGIAAALRGRLSGSAPVNPRDVAERPTAFRVSGGPQWHLVEERARGVIERRDVADALDRFIAHQPRGYFIIEGGPGDGKTAVAANFVVQRGLAHCFFGRNQRGASNDVFRSLIGQLEDPRGSIPASATPEELSERFEQALRQRATLSRPLIVVFDGLNELELPADLHAPFFPAETLPEGVYVVVTSQPCDQLDILKEDTALVPTVLHRLRPLQPDEIRAMVTPHLPMASEVLITRLGDASKGSPLYLRAMVDALLTDPNADPRDFPRAVEGYYRRTLRSQSANPVLREVLALLAVCREHPSLTDLSEVTGHAQRAIYEQAIVPLRPHLVETADRVAFYHERFVEFVTNELLFGDELKWAHRKLADWLLSSTTRRDLYWTALPYHLFHSGQFDRLVATVDTPFLREKLQRFGYDVIEDFEFIANALLESRQTAFLKPCVERLDALRAAVGDAAVDVLARRTEMRRRSTGAKLDFTTRPMATIPGIDVCAMLLPKADVTADFVEAAPRGDTLVVAIGDAPRTGLNSAFVARFIARLFTWLVQSRGSIDVGEVLDALGAEIRGHEYFQRVSMQCVELMPRDRRMVLASAGHPYPVRYSATTGRIDRLNVQGPLLHAPQPGSDSTRPYRARHSELHDGDVVVLLTDGIIDGGPVDDPYGYRFMALLGRLTNEKAKTICEAVIADWLEHQRGAPVRDDAAIIVVRANPARPLEGR